MQQIAAIQTIITTATVATTAAASADVITAAATTASATTTATATATCATVEAAAATTTNHGPDAQVHRIQAFKLLLVLIVVVVLGVVQLKVLLLIGVLVAFSVVAHGHISKAAENVVDGISMASISKQRGRTRPSETKVTALALHRQAQSSDIGYLGRWRIWGMLHAMPWSSDTSLSVLAVANKVKGRQGLREV
jgi:hypothetical protein